MQIMKPSRVLVATFVVAGLTASPALASGGPIHDRSSDAKDAAAAISAWSTVDDRSSEAQDTSRPDTAGNANVTARKDLRTTASLAGPPPGSAGIYVPPAGSAEKAPQPGPPQFPTNTVPLHRPAPEPVSAPPAGDGFDVTDAVIGAGGAAVLLVAVAGGVAVTRRRRFATAA
jgi:hypothetical protein